MLGAILGSLGGNWIANKLFNGGTSSSPDWDAFEDYSTSESGGVPLSPVGSSGVHATSPLASVLGSLGGAVLSALGVESANQRNERLMREQWQREDTAIQRRVADLRAAGLSPVLAAGSAATSSQPVTMHSSLSSFEDAGKSILDAVNLNRSLSLAESQIKSMSVNNALHEMQMDKISTEISKLNKEIKYLGWLRVSQIGRNWSGFGRDISSEVRNWTRLGRGMY